MSLRKLTSMGLMVAVAVGALAVAARAGNGTPPAPPWVNADGTVDESRMPARIPVLDENGDVKGYVITSQLEAGKDLLGLEVPAIPLFASKAGSRVIGKFEFGGSEFSVSEFRAP